MDVTKPVLKVADLSKKYSNGVQALDKVNLTIPTGMFGLLGPNGAGKSSLMRILATIQEPDSGEVWLGNINVLKEKEKARRVLGYLPQDFGLYPKVSAVALLDHIASLKGVRKEDRKDLVEALLLKVNLHQHRKKNLGTFSGGMKQRFGIAQALIGDPQMIIVDEPTAGLDPSERNRFYNLLSQIGETSVVILSTHIIEDVTQLCSNLAILNQGKVLEQGSTSEIRNKVKDKIWKKKIEHHKVKEFGHLDIISNHLSEGKIVLHVYSDLDPGHGFEATEGSLEDMYFHSIKKGPQDGFDRKQEVSNKNS